MSESNKDNKSNLPKFKFNSYWIYGAIFIAIIAFQFFNSGDLASKTISKNKFEEILNDFVITTMSYFNTGGKKEVEKVYQAFLLGLLVNLSIDYEVTSEKESGYGRYDISIVPKLKNKKAVIMELKRIETDETKDEALNSALAQIEEKKYESTILAKGISDIDKLGIVFDGKRVWVKK